MSEESSVDEPAAQRIRLNSSDTPINSKNNNESGTDISTRSNDLPAEQCTSANFFAEPYLSQLTDRQRLRWALRTEAEVRFAKLQMRNQEAEAAAAAPAAAPPTASTSASSSSSAGPRPTDNPTGNESSVNARNDTLNSKYLIDLYPSPAPSEQKDAKPEASSTVEVGDMTDEDRANYRIFMRDRERYHRKLLPALSEGRDPDDSVVSTLAKLDIDRPSHELFRDFDEKLQFIQDLNYCATSHRREWFDQWRRKIVKDTMLVIKAGTDDSVYANECLGSIKSGQFTVDQLDGLPLDVQQLIYWRSNGRLNDTLSGITKKVTKKDMKRAGKPAPAPPNLLFFELILEGYMGYDVPNYHSATTSVPRAAVMGGALVAALTAWQSHDVRILFVNADIADILSRRPSPEIVKKYLEARRRIVRALNDHFLCLGKSPESPYSTGDVDIFLQSSPFSRNVRNTLTVAGIHGDALDHVNSYLGNGGSIYDLKRFAHDLCESHLESKFCEPYTTMETPYTRSITKSDTFFYALGSRGLSFTLALGADDPAAGKNEEQKYNDNAVWPRSTQLITLDEKADLVGCLLDFDTSVAACAYDGITVRVTPRAAYSLLTSVQIVTPNVLKEKRNRGRIVKYYKRGFDAYVLDPYCSHSSQCVHDLDMSFPQFTQSKPNANIERTNVEWRAQHLRDESTYFEMLEDVEEGRWHNEGQCIKACCRIAEGRSDDRCAALFELRPGHAVEFLSKRHGWTEEEKRRVAALPATRHFTCRTCRYEYAIWLVFSGDPRVELLDLDLRGEGLSFLFGVAYKGGLTHMTASFYGCSAINSVLVRDRARTDEQMEWLFQSQLIAERAKYLVQHLGEECATSKKLSLFGRNCAPGGYQDRFLCRSSLNDVLSEGEKRVFPSNAKAPVGLNPERFVEICEACDKYMLGYEFGATLCEQCKTK